VAVALVEEAGTDHIVASLQDVELGSVVREGRVGLVQKAIPAGAASALAEFLVSGRGTAAILEVVREGDGGPVLAASPPLAEEKRLDLRPREAAPPVAVASPRAAPTSKRLGWTALGTGVAALGLATFAYVETGSASSSYDSASRLRGSGGINTVAALDAYNRQVAAGDAANRMAAIGWIGAGAGAIATGVLGYVNYRRTGAIGPLRF
jgi:hypothetical protein